MFKSQRPCGSSDITDQIFHVTLQDHVIKGPLRKEAPRYISPHWQGW